MESQPTKRGVPGRYGLANAETDGHIVFSFEPAFVAHAAYTALRSLSHSSRCPNHPNYQHGAETLGAKQKRSLKLAELRMIENDLHNRGLIKSNRTVGRKPTGG